MIPIKELSIGNWVRTFTAENVFSPLEYFNGQIAKIISPDYVAVTYKDSVIEQHITNLNPIPITPEFLKKNLFSITTKDVYSRMLRLGGILHLIFTPDDTCFLMLNGSRIRMSGVHQLQNILTMEEETRGVKIDV